MKWYWWVVTLILALNGLLIAFLGMALGLGRVRRSRAARAEAKAAAEEDGTKPEVN